MKPNQSPKRRKMDPLNLYLVPIDFSKTSENALDYAIRLMRKDKGRLLLIQVITEPASNVPFQLRSDYYKALNKEADDYVGSLARRKGLRPRDYRFIAVRGGSAARVIADQAKKSRASMIVMGSHGRTGLQRVVLGSVAEETLRHAKCPVLIVK